LTALYKLNAGILAVEYVKQKGEDRGIVVIDDG
jgi:hypothetical protein